MDLDEVSEYLQARNFSIESLSYVWKKAKPQLEALLAENEKILPPDNFKHIKNAFGMLSDGIMPSILDEKEKNMKKMSVIQQREQSFFQQIVPSLAEIFKDLFYGYLENTRYIQGDEHISKLAKGFAKYNIDLRYPSIASNPPTYPNSTRPREWQYDHMDEILDCYTGIVNLTQSIRNFVSHVKDPKTKRLLTSLNREITDPVSDANSSGNMFVLTGMIILVIHEFREVLQTWLDTIKLGGAP